MKEANHCQFDNSILSIVTKDRVDYEGRKNEVSRQVSEDSFQYSDESRFFLTQFRSSMVNSMRVQSTALVKDKKDEYR